MELANKGCMLYCGVDQAPNTPHTFAHQHINELGYESVISPLLLMFSAAVT